MTSPEDVRPARTKLVRRPSGARNTRCLISRWFHHRLMSGVAPGRDSQPLEHREKCLEFMGRSCAMPYRPGEKRSTGVNVIGPIKPDSRGVQLAALNKPSGPAFSRLRGGIL